MPPPIDPDAFADHGSGLPRHGGDLAAAERRFGRPPGGWLDLSTGVNPYAYPLPDIPAEAWSRLPDAAAELALRQAAAAHYGTGDPAAVVPAPGGQAIIQWLPRLLDPGTVTVVSPTYAEHAASWSAAGHAVVERAAPDLDDGSRVVVVVNPNNPDGARYDPDGLLALAGALAARGGLLVVDESFADTEPEISLAGRLVTGLVVIRSFGKFFGLPGLRLGFALCAPPLAEALRDALGPWPVSGPALAVGARALADARWSAEMRRRLRAEARGLDRLLGEAGLGVIGGTALFRLVQAPRAWALYEYLGGRGILVRPFATAPRWLRFGLPPGPDGRRRLRKALSEWNG